MAKQIKPVLFPNITKDVFELMEEYINGQEDEKNFYCQADVETGSICVTQCTHCESYYKPLEDEFNNEKQKKCKKKHSNW